VLRVDQDRQVGPHLPVHRDPPLPDHLFHVPPRLDTGVGEDLLDAFFHEVIITAPVGIGYDPHRSLRP
jgi:hypothetical protein